MKTLLGFKKLLVKLLDWMLIVALAALVLDVVWGVFSRYVLNAQAKWTEELARFLLIWVSLLGGAVAFGAKAHLGVDFLVVKFHPSARKLMAVVVHLVVLAFAVSIFVVGGTAVVRDALAMEQTTPALGLKMGHVYLALPLSGFFMVVFVLQNLLEDLAAKEAADD